MSYKKLSLLLVIALVFLLLVSLGLISTWFYYYFYGKKDPEKTALQSVTTDTLLAKGDRRDSLEKMYLATIGNFHEDSTGTVTTYAQDTLKASIDSKLHEFYRLKSEISTLLQNKGSDKDLDSARVKIAYLQQRIEELRNRTVAIESDNRRLTEIVKQLNTRINTPRDNRSAAPARRDSYMPSPLPEKKPVSPGFSTSELRVAAWANNNGKDQETTEAAKTEKLTGTLVVKNAAAAQGAEIMVVVQQPDGRVLKNSDWETGTFSTPEGRMVYSARIPFDYNKGESKKLSFAITAGDLPKGEYVIKVYNNGNLVGKTSKFLF